MLTLGQSSNQLDVPLVNGLSLSATSTPPLVKLLHPFAS